jgi:uncharacterized protein
VSIWAIADIHASRSDPQTLQPSKPMDVFGDVWTDHVRRIEAAWAALVGPDDTVIVAGDTEWALRLEDARETLERMHMWPGKKVLLRGNHDYWWSSKTTGRVRRALPASFHALHNDSVQVEGFNICGAKGSPLPNGTEWTAQDEKLLNRERERLALSLRTRNRDLPTIVALHYPPFYPRQTESAYRELLEEAGVSACVYGHLHGAAGGAAVEGRYGRVVYRLVAADAVGFRPVLIAGNGDVVVGERIGGRDAGERAEVMEEDDGGDLRGLAEDVMADKRDDGSGELRTRELYDVPSEDAAQLDQEQASGDGARG